MIVECPKCGKKKAIKLTEELRGKRIGFTCTNNGCGEKIKVLIPKAKESHQDRKTVIYTTKRNQNSGSLLLLDDTGHPVGKYSLNVGINIIGRKSTNSRADIALETNDLYISRMHCVITVIEQETGILFLLKDYGSKNHILVNDQLLNEKEEIYLQDGDIIQMGKTNIKLELK